MACYDDIVTLGLCPDDGTPTSGFELIKAPGISLKNLGDIASDSYIKGSELAMEKKSQALTIFKNDFIGALQANQVVATISEPVYNSSVINQYSNKGTYAGYRGLTLNKASSYRGTLRQTIIKSVQCYPLASGDTVLLLDDGINTYSYPITLVANQVNTFNEDNLSGFPFVIRDTANAIRVTIDQTQIAFASAELTCGIGCNGGLPNPCGYVEGWDGTAKIKGEGYGINLEFYCSCNYEQVLCDLSKSFSGELIWLKWQILIFQEHRMSNRFSSMVIYNKEQTEEWLKELERQYVNKWNSMMQGLFGILKTYKDDCLNCRDARWITNI